MGYEPGSGVGEKALLDPRFRALGLGLELVICCLGLSVWFGVLGSRPMFWFTDSRGDFVLEVGCFESLWIQCFTKC